MTDTVAILGRGKTRKYMEYAENVDYWAMNDDVLTIPIHNVKALFEMHTDWTVRYPHSPQYTEFITKRLPFPVFTHGVVEQIPSSVAFPLHAMPKAYFTCTVAYAIAYAATLTDYKNIELWGVDLMNEPGQIYHEQRTSVYYWMGRAEGMGKRIVLPRESQLFKAPIYYSPLANAGEK